MEINFKTLAALFVTITTAVILAGSVLNGDVEKRFFSVYCENENNAEADPATYSEHCFGDNQ